jgi:leader peptidase (prepilin peptidase)/N-methyltransferase
VAEVWGGLIDAASGGPAAHFNAFLSAIFGYLIGGLLIWGMRILGTLGFGKEAMGLGDVHLLAAVGAVTGWIVPSIAFFVAPIFGLGWALYLWRRKGRRELPYGPWLAAATLVVMLFYDGITNFLRPYAHTIQLLVK